MSNPFLDNADQDFSQNLSLRDKKIYDSPSKTDLPFSGHRIPIKILPTYIFNLSTPQNQKILASKRSTPQRDTSARPSSRISASEKKGKSTQKKKKVLKRSESSVKKTKKITNIMEVPNFQFELEKLIRAVFRHCVVCKEFKNELNRVNAETLLNFYAKNRLEEN